MTREEAKKEVTRLRPMYHDEIYKMLNEIYDEVESRVCENCKYWDGVGHCSLIEWGCVASFGCNEHERK